MVFLINAIHLFFIISVRYFLVAGGAYWWVWRRGRLDCPKLQVGIPDRRIRWMEIRYSLLSSVIFAVAGALVFGAWQRGETRLYLDVHRYGWGYLVASFFLLLFVHDTYFYFTHRLMHLPRLFKAMHAIHHLSRNPTPWTAFSFHPWEALVSAAIFPALVCVIPIHLAVFFLFLLVMTVLSVVNHLGYELYPNAFLEHPVGKWFISATSHDRHHQDVRVNYGLYFSFWDRWLGAEELKEKPGRKARPGHTESLRLGKRFLTSWLS